LRARSGWWRGYVIEDGVFERRGVDLRGALFEMRRATLLGVDLLDYVLEFELGFLSLFLSVVLLMLGELDGHRSLLLFGVRHIFKYAYPS
jgi:hypothetical protein